MIKHLNINSYTIKEMENYYIKRTNKHINLVNKYCNKLNNNGLSKRGKLHDYSKLYNIDEYTPYILITWKYYCRDNNIKFELPQHINDIMDQASEHHILNNPHHPEYHQEIKQNLINKNNRDDIPDQTIDATKMDFLSILEMCCDWCAMSEERKNSPFEWADKVINKRWKFTDEQINLIYNTLNKLWNL